MSLGGKFNKYGTAPRGITDAQCAQALTELQTLIADLLPWEAKDPHALSEEDAMIRFLVGNKYDARATAAAMREYAAWRADFGCDRLLTEAAFDPQIPELHHVGFGGQDWEGHPLHVELLNNHHLEQLLKAHGHEELFRWHVYVAEWQRRVMKAWGSDRVTVIVDLKNVDLSILSHFNVASLLKRCAVDDQAHYPETKRHLFFINAPFGASKCWKVFSAVLDHRVRDKFHIWGAKEWRQNIAEYVDLRDLPRELGGDGPALRWLTAHPAAFRMPEPPQEATCPSRESPPPRRGIAVC